MIRKLYLILFLSACYAQHTVAQVTGFSNVNTSVGASAFVYLGDLTPNQFGDVSRAKAGLQFAVKVPLTKNLGLRGSFITGSLDGDDKRYDGWRPKRAFSFKSDIKEVAVHLQWEFAGNGWDWAEEDRYTANYQVRKFKRVSPYIFVGVGYAYNQVTRDMTGTDSVFFAGDIAWTNYYLEKNKVYKSGTMTMPLGIGTHIAFSRSVRMYLEYCYHAVFNDYLDGFATAVVSNKPDAYQTYTIGLDFRFLKYGTRRKNEICNLNLQ